MTTFNSNEIYAVRNQYNNLDKVLAFNCIYLPATDTKPARIKIIANQLSESITFAFDCEFNSMPEHAFAMLERLGFKVTSQVATSNDSAVFICHYDYRSISEEFKLIK